MNLCALLILVIFTTTSWAKDVETFPDLNLNDGRALKEATRVLEEEVKLAARPHTYVLIDLATKSVHIKGRGVDLLHIPIIAWTAGSKEEFKGIHKLVARPSVVRRKINPGSASEQEPISLADMPTDYVLSFTPPMTITVVPSAMSEHPVQSVLNLGKAWWHGLTNWTTSLMTDQASKSPHLHLTITADHAQSLAWALVDGMALVIRRPTDN